MTYEEMIEIFRKRDLNSKTNNYIFCETTDFSFFNEISELCSISTNENDVDIDVAHNIVVDLKKTEVKDTLSYVLEFLTKKELLDKDFDYKLDFNDKFDLFKFQGILRSHRIIVQLIFLTWKN